MKAIIVCVFALSTVLEVQAQYSDANKENISKIADSMRAERVVIENSELDNVFRIDEGIYRSGQPSSKDFAALEAYGMRSVLNLRNWHSDDDEAENTNLKLYRIKSRATQLTEKQITEALKIILDSPKGIVFHCWHGSDRTGAVAAAYRIIFQDWNKEDAIDEMLNGGFGFHEQFADEIVPLIKRLDVEKIRKTLGLTK